MNKARRKELNEIIGVLETQPERLEGLRDIESECYENMPESLQESEKGDEFEQNISDIDDAIDYISDVTNYIQEVIDR